MVGASGLVLITYRGRATHLEVITTHLRKHWSELTIAVIEQADTNAWNKGLLYNIGYKLLSSAYDYVILHDVDFIPVLGEVDYSYCDLPCMIAGRASQFNYQLLYSQFFGGVVVVSKTHYVAVNGFSNQYKGYGGEDDGLYQSFIQKGIQPQVKMGKFECFAHPKPDIRPGTGFYNTLDYQNNLKLCTSPRDFTEGLSTIDTLYHVDDIHYEPNYMHIKIITNG